MAGEPLLYLPLEFYIYSQDELLLCGYKLFLVHSFHQISANYLPIGKISHSLLWLLTFELDRLLSPILIRGFFANFINCHFAKLEKSPISNYLNKWRVYQQLFINLIDLTAVFCGRQTYCVYRNLVHELALLVERLSSKIALNIFCYCRNLVLSKKVRLSTFIQR